MGTINPGDIITLDPKQEEIYKIILNELGMINVKWGEYQFLYSTPSYRQVMTEVAATFFYLQQQSQMRDVLQSLCRLHDPAVSFSFENCSMHWLAKNLPVGTVKIALQNALTAIEPKFLKIKNWRDKMGSHNDYVHIASLTPGAPLFQLSDVDEVIRLTNDAFNIVAAHDSRQAGTYPFTVPVIKGAEELVHFVQEHIQEHKKRKAT